LGRLTLNPLPHLDLTGSLLFIATAVTGPFVIGWAKPVPVDTRYFRNQRRDMMLVSFAGPLANFALALLFCLVYLLLIRLIRGRGIEPDVLIDFIRRASATGVWVNVTLAWFNLLPLPPLDGSHILGGCLPWSLARPYYSLGRYGILILIVLLASGVLHHVMRPLVENTVTIMEAWIRHVVF
jgi:Zn-dependent protease